MSNIDSTPAISANPFIGLLPADTANNLVYGLTLLKSLRSDSVDHDEGMGLFFLLEALRAAAHKLSLQLHKDGRETLAEMIARRDELRRDLEDIEVDIQAMPE